MDMFTDLLHVLSSIGIIALSSISLCGLIAQNLVVWQRQNTTALSPFNFFTRIAIYIAGTAYAGHRGLFTMIACNAIRLPFAITLATAIIAFNPRPWRLTALVVATAILSGASLGVPFIWNERINVVLSLMSTVAALDQLRCILQRSDTGSLSLAFVVSQLANDLFWNGYLFSTDHLMVTLTLTSHTVASLTLLVAWTMYRRDRITPLQLQFHEAFGQITNPIRLLRTRKTLA